MAKNNKTHQVIEKKSEVLVVDNINNRNLEHYAAMVSRATVFHHKCKERGGSKNRNRDYQNDGD